MVRVYRKDFLEGYEIGDDPDKLKDFQEGGYTTNFAEAEAASKLAGGQNFTGSDPVDSSVDNDAVVQTVEQTKVLLPYLTKLDPVRGDKLIKAYTEGFNETGKQIN